MDRFDREKEDYEDVRRIVEEYFEQNNLDEDGNRQKMLQEKNPISQNKFVNKPWSLADMVNNMSKYQAPYRMGQTAGILHSSLNEMKTAQIPGGDNLYHRLAMCRAAQGGADQYLYALGAGLLKEGVDIVRKISKGKPVIETIKDSGKDIKNNLEGLNYGLHNPNKNCRIWLNDLDIKTNTWKK